MNRLQRKYRERQIELDKIRAKKLMSNRKKFKWRKIHTQSLPSLKRNIRQHVKDFGPEVTKEISKTNGNIETISKRFKRNHVVVKKG